MIYKLDNISMKKMLELPESGIGYQLIKARMDNEKHIKSYVVFNSELLIEHDEKLKVYSHTLIGNGYEILLKVLSTINLTDIQLITGRQEAGTMELEKNFKTGQNIGLSGKSNIYIRPSIYFKDNRIDIDKKILLPGSYVTTVESYTNCHITLNDPVELFTLPVQQDYINIIYVKQYEKNIQIKDTFNNDFNRTGGGDKICFKTAGELLLKSNEKLERMKMQSNI